MHQEGKPQIRTLLDYNTSRYTAEDILSGKEFRRLRRKQLRK